MTTPEYRIENLSRTFKTGHQRVEALKDVSFEVNPGERIGIVGESGSGKTTLVRLMIGLDKPTSGKVFFRGTEITRLEENKLGTVRNNVQMVFQDPHSSLNPRMTVGNIIQEPLRSPLFRRRNPQYDVRHRVMEVADLVGLTKNDLAKFPHEFSGGQRQRIAIARALAPKPSILIADEPVSALDVSVRGHILNLLHQVADEYRLTLLFISHDLMVVRHMCRQVMILQAGQIVEAGCLERIFQQPSHQYTKELLAAIPVIKTS